MNAHATPPGQPRPTTQQFPGNPTFVGRSSDLAMATSMLKQEHIRLVTVLGPGGIGKTRLVNEVALLISGDYADGSAFVSLEAVTDARFVGAAIASALHVTPPHSSNVFPHLFRALAERDLLLILDTFEHVPDAALDIARLLANCTHLKVLATSRAPLAISGEHLLPLSPLGLATDDTPLSIDALRTIESIQLFVNRAREVNPAFELTTGNMNDVSAICDSLDGLPLAIELAAAQIRVLPPPTLRARILAHHPLPISGPRDAPLRLRTLHNTISWSYDLLDHHERELFRCLSVFRGSFGLDAAEAICPAPIPVGVHQEQPGDIVPGLGNLVSNSLVMQKGWQDEARYGMLKTIRQFSRVQLESAGESLPARIAHAEYYLGLAEQLQWAWLTGSDNELDRLEVDHPNLLAALAFYWETHDTDRIMLLATSLTGFWYTHTHDQIATMWLARALECAQTTSPFLCGRLYIAHGIILCSQGETDQAMEALSSGVSSLKESDDVASITVAHIWQGAVSQRLGAFDQAEDFLANALKLAHRVKTPKLRAALMARTLSNLGIVAAKRGDVALAIRRYDAALRLYLKDGPLPGMIRALGDRGAIACDQGDFTGSMTYFRKCLALGGSRTDRRVFAEVLEWSALIAAAWNQPAHAARLLGAATAIGSPLGESVAHRASHGPFDRALEAIHGQMSRANIRRAMDNGHKMSIDQILTDIQALAPTTSPADTGANDAIKLSQRELEVLRLLSAGHQNREIAKTLFLSVRTIEAHVLHIYQKLGVQTRTAAVAVAIEKGFADPESARDSER